MNITPYKVIISPLIIASRLLKLIRYKRYGHINVHTAIHKTCIIQGKGFDIGRNVFIGRNGELISYEGVGDVNPHGTHGLDARVIIGDNTRIHPRCRITAAREIVIEDCVLIAPDVFITDHNHGRNPEIDDGYATQPLDIRPVRIRHGVWLGQRVCVLPGVTIGKCAIVGANSVVTHDIPAYSIAVGSPAKIVKRWSFENKRWESRHE